jgi:hypothetical protein
MTRLTETQPIQTGSGPFKGNTRAGASAVRDRSLCVRSYTMVTSRNALKLATGDLRLAALPKIEAAE